MFLAKRSFVVLAVFALAILVAGASLAGPAPETTPNLGGHAYWDKTTGKTTWDSAIHSVYSGVDVYSNVLSAANFGLSSTDLTSIWGDLVTTTATGTVEEQDFTIYNSGSSSGPLMNAVVVVDYYDGATSTLLGGFATSPLDFGPTGLPPGFYSIVTVTGLSGLGINLGTTSVIVTQQVTDHTGAANRLGIVSLDPPTIGSSIPQMYIDSSTIGPAGFYTVANQNANPGYRINVMTGPVPTRNTTWGRIKSLYR